MSAFDIRTLCCACGATDVMCIDPGSEPEIDPFSDLMLQRGQPVRAWCMECFAEFAALLPCEAEKRRKTGVIL